MELAEAQILAENGMQLAAIFQQRQNQSTDFTSQKGYSAGRRAYRYAQDDIGQPAGTAIYYAVDFDASTSEIDDRIVPYFEGVKRAFAEESGGQPEYRVGAYGSGLVCKTLAARGLIEFSWLAMSRGFRGTQEALENGEFHLAQRAPESKLCGLSVDFNDVNPNRPDFGAFSIEGDSKAQAPTTVGEPYRVIARSGLRLREGPGTQFDVVGVLKPGQIVYVSSITDHWAHVDVEGDGQIDGLASAAFLMRISV